MLKLPLFVALFLVVRGVPALAALPRRACRPRPAALAFFWRDRAAAGRRDHDARPETGHMRTSTAAALVGAAIISTLAFPIAGMRLRRGQVERPALDEMTSGPGGTPAAPS